jgi:peptidoglycan/LPS O-acetylase OafA/YrhL
MLVAGAGNMTYSCYLLHFPLQLIIALTFSALQWPIQYHDHLFWAAYVLTNAASLALRLSSSKRRRSG